MRRVHALPPPRTRTVRQRSISVRTPKGSPPPARRRHGDARRIRPPAAAPPAADRPAHRSRPVRTRVEHHLRPALLGIVRQRQPLPASFGRCRSAPAGRRPAPPPRPPPHRPASRSPPRHRRHRQRLLALAPVTPAPAGTALEQHLADPPLDRRHRRAQIGLDQPVLQPVVGKADPIRRWSFIACTGSAACGTVVTSVNIMIDPSASGRARRPAFGRKGEQADGTARAPRTGTGPGISVP
jgi:hypothetical protein